MQECTRKTDDKNRYDRLLRSKRYSAKYTLSPNGDIFLTEADRLYIDKHHYPKDCVNRCITDFTESDFQRQLKKYMHIGSVNKKPFSFLEEDENGNFIQVTVLAESSAVLLTGKLVSLEQLALEREYVSIGFGCQNQPYIFDLNTEFARLLKAKKVSLNTLLMSRAFYQAYTNMSSYTEKFSYQSHEKINEYQLTAMPVIRNGRILFVNLFLKNIGDSDIFSAWKMLTPREKEIIYFTAQGYSNRYIAFSLHIKEGTVKRNLYNCYKKLSVGSRADIIKIFYHRNKCD